MEERVLNDDVARKFLLGQLSAEEQGQIEELAFENPKTFEFLQAAESDLIDEFLEDDLSSDEKERFQKHFLKQPGRSADLRVARTLQLYLSKQPVAAAVKAIDPSKRFSLAEWIGVRVSPLRISLVAVALIVAAIGILLLVRVIQQQQRAPMQARQDQPTPVPTQTPTSTVTPSPSSSPSTKENQNKPSPPPRQPAPAAYAILLTPSIATRSEGQEATIPMPRALDLPLIDGAGFRSYLAELQRDERTIFRWPNLQPQELKSGKGFQVPVRAGLLQPDRSYRIVLSGVSPNGRSQRLQYYYFKVNPTVQP